MAVDVRERAEPVELHLKVKIGVIERLRQAEQAHRAKRRWMKESQGFRIAYGTFSTSHGGKGRRSARRVVCRTTRSLSHAPNTSRASGEEWVTLCFSPGPVIERDS